jgi:hypothetical protein
LPPAFELKFKNNTFETFNQFNPETYLDQVIGPVAAVGANLTVEQQAELDAKTLARQEIAKVLE